MQESQVQEFWQGHPCGELKVGGLDSYDADVDAFFTQYDAFRFATEGHILKCLDGISLQGKRTLEIGLGQGADSEQLIRRGAVWSGVDLTAESIRRVRLRLTLRNLPFKELKQGSVTKLPFEDKSFDVVYSHGVLHHVPDIHLAQREIRRVLKPGGELVVMLYAKYSLNYLLSIFLLRRLGLVALYYSGYRPGGLYNQHLDNAKKMGLWRYLRMKNFIHKNTDGPLNPYAKVYDRRHVERDFPDFEITRMYRQFMHAPPLPVRRLPLERWLGWHLWVHLRPRPSARQRAIGQA